MKKKLLLCLFALAAFCCAAVPSFAQITLEERDIIIEEIMKRLNIEEIVDKAIEARMPDIDLKVTEAMDAKYSNIKNEIREEVSENLKTDLLNGDIVLPYQSAAQEAPAEKKQDAQEKQSTQA
ncbi:MAG: hypothetical protein IJI14_20700, partial [Anaerolineaceae bacterium]|nr:hypothetical protein [Anaerolineaceae bacterium]